MFPRSNRKAELVDSAAPDSIATCHKAGWIEKESFKKWFEYIISSVKLSKKHPIILTLDGHYSHPRNIEVIGWARENWVHIVCLPPHSTHKLKLPDFSCLQPLKTYYAQEIEIWLKNHPNRVVTHYQITGTVEKAYLKSATAAIAVKVFKKTGLFLCKLHIYDKHDWGRISAQHHQLFAWQLCAVYRNCRRTAYHWWQKSTNPNQQSLSLPHKTSLLLSCHLTLTLIQIYLVGNKNSQQNMSLHGKNLLLFDQLGLQKKKLKEDRKRKANTDQSKASSKIIWQKKRPSGPSDANVSAILGEYEM